MENNLYEKYSVKNNKMLMNGLKASVYFCHCLIILMKINENSLFVFSLFSQVG